MSNLAAETQALCELIRDRFGVDYEYRLEQLTLRLESRLAAVGCANLPEYAEFLRRHAAREREFLSLGSVVANPQTAFFREPAQIQYFAGALCEELLKKNRLSGELRIWSAGCSSGEEPYSIAIAIAQLGRIPLEAVTIFATDISEQALAQARAAVYSAASVAAIPGVIREQYFLPVGDGYTPIGRIRNRVRFAHLNLLDHTQIAELAPFDAIFCRNVLLYFAREHQTRVTRSLVARLSPGGYLVLGHSDARIELAGQLELCRDGEFVVGRRSAPAVRGPALGTHADG